MEHMISVTREEAAALLPERPEAMHKGGRGRLLIVGGSERYPGAPALSALGALRSGSGVTTLLSLPSVCAACAARLPEATYRPIEDRTQWLDAALEDADAYGAAVIGPGLDRSDEAMDFVIGMWERWPKPLLVDGDGLFALASKGESLPLRHDAVLTPHEGEAARLMGTTSDVVRASREASAGELANRWGCVLLKGHGTLVGLNGKETLRQLKWGGPELAVPGSGDVLSGCVGAFLAGGMTPSDAALLGAALHGMAGNRLWGGGVDGVLASDIAHALRDVINELREWKA